MNKISDPYEIARQSSCGFWSKADSARYVAYCLWELRSGTPIDPAPIGRDMEGANAALLWGWLRESSLALELIIKAALAEKTRLVGTFSVPAHHNVPQLWKMADLPKTSWTQEYHLCGAHQVLQWAGRYAAPRKGALDLFEQMASGRPHIDAGRARMPEPVKVDWESFDALYLTAEHAYFSRRSESQSG